MGKFNDFLKRILLVAIGTSCLLAPAFAGQTGKKTVTNKTGQSFDILAFSDGARRDKYAVFDPVENRPYWYAQGGSANAGKGETGIATSTNQWCRVRYIYGDDVRVPECWGSFMYSSHLITGIDGLHYEISFSPSSLSYFKLRAQETNTWYAHDGSANDGRKSTTKEDWCRVIIYDGNGILKVPEECGELLQKIAAVSAGIASPAETTAEMQALDKVLGFGWNAGVEVTGNAVDIAKGKFSPGGLGVGIAVGYGTEAVKNAFGLTAKNANAGAISAEILTTAAVNTSVTTMIMTAAGSTFNPVTAGIGFAVAGAMEGGKAIYKASKDTGVVLQPGYGDNPRYNRDLNGLVSVTKEPLLLDGTWKWADCGLENQRCNFQGTHTVRYGANNIFIEKVASDGFQCAYTAFGRDPVPNVVKKCQYKKANGEN